MTTKLENGERYGTRFSSEYMTAWESRNPYQKSHEDPLPTGNAVTLNEYQNWARCGATYGDKGLPRLAYAGLAITGEAGEFSDEVKKLYRDDSGALSAARHDKMVKELGDVLWYVANAAADLGLTLQDIAQANSKKLTERYPDREPLG